MANANQLLTENITDWKDIGEIQNQVTLAQYGARSGLYTIEWSVAAEMNIQCVSALPIGTYYLKAPQVEASANTHTWDNFFIPAGTITVSAWVHTHEAKAGSGLITPHIGTDNFTRIDAVGVVDDTATLVAGDLILTDSDFNIVINTDTVTARGFTLFLEYYIGNV